MIIMILRMYVHHIFTIVHTKYGTFTSNGLGEIEG